MITFRILSKRADAIIHADHALKYLAKYYGSVIAKISTDGKLSRIVIENVDISNSVAGILTAQLLDMGCSSVHAINETFVNSSKITPEEQALHLL